ncbi:hypothetical protein EDB83DRAFT_2508328 [Lactarius deliciosus]|nr:hypothetical protein EDB83DRAFT_2508328 [Lactarius deliciosus]
MTDKITTEYHPNSGRPPRTQSFDEYNDEHQFFSSRPTGSAEPWLPFFNTREDFEFAEILMESNMSKVQSERLIKLVKLCLNRKGTLTFSNYSDLQTTWDRAASQLTPFSVDNILVRYNGVDQTFPMSFRPLWDWAVDLIMNPQLVDRFVWDAQRIFRHNGETTTRTRVYHEPWTGDALWDLQSQIPEGARPLGFVLYADKTKLSSFGTAKGYPVIARCANLPAEIRNGNGVGGGRVVGWLPIVPETSKDTGKTAFVNFKREVWHRAFHSIIKSIVEKSVVGCWLQGSDGTQHQYFPAIIILSADYEEQCIMSLIRGLGGKRPCPICVVPNDKLADISRTWTLRTAARTQELLKEAQSLNNAESENLLSMHGIRNVDNVFWEVYNSDPHRALSFDRLHSNNSGLFGDHLLSRFDLAPRWRGLYHFSDMMNTSFTDGSKYEDISKVVVFAAHNVIQEDDKEGWQLLLCLRSFSIVDLLLSFEVHTDETILAGRRELVKFGLLMKEYIELSTKSTMARNEAQKKKNKNKNKKEKEKPVKDWNFPKMHALVHSFDDIKAKGATRNYNTKPNEKLHGPLKKAYLRQTNFKDVAPQILKFEHQSFVAALIRDQIDEVDAAKAAIHKDDEVGHNSPEGPGTQEHCTINLSLREPPVVEHSSKRKNPATFDAGAVILRSQQRPPLTFEDLRDQGPIFCDFRTRLSDWLTTMFPLYDDLSFPPGCTRVEFEDTDKLTEYRSMKVCYELKVDWQQYLDYVYCNSKFHNQERRDFVILKTTTGFIFAQLLFIFTCSVAGKSHPICLTRPLDAPMGQPRIKDRSLRLRRLRSKNSTEFFFVRSIVRGAPLIQAFDNPDDYFVMDVVDHSGDLFIRCEEIFGG